jgi:hypothetical protein
MMDNSGINQVNKMKIKLGILLLLTALVWTGAAVAQNIDAEWTRWDTTLTFQPESDQVEVSEVQEFNILQGPVRLGVRAWEDPVEILNVFVVAPGQRPVQLEQGNSDEPGTFTLEQDGGEIVLQYNLPEPAQSGDTFVVQINYVTEANAEGLLDWHIIPGDHGFPIQSSTTVLNFVDMTPPDSSLVRVIAGDATVSTANNQIVLQAGPLSPDEALQIQVPFGEGVGTAGGSNNQPVQPIATVPSGGVQTVPSQPQEPASDNLLGIDMSTVLLVLCGIGLLVLFGGGSLLRSLLGGFLGGGGGGLTPGGGGIFPRSGGTSGGSRPVNPGGSGGSTSRGFRPSSRQSRSLPTVRSSKKGSGGRAGLG